jgi:hypothetical protein
MPQTENIFAKLARESVLIGFTPRSISIGVSKLKMTLRKRTPDENPAAGANQI